MSKVVAEKTEFEKKLDRIELRAIKGSELVLALNLGVITSEQFLEHHKKLREEAEADSPSENWQGEGS